MNVAKENIERGQKLTLDLTSWGRLGEAMAEYAGMDVFVFGGIPGERVVAEVIRVRRKHLAARLVEVLEPSIDRVKPPCRYFGDCTGCQWQHLDYEAQLKAKSDKVIDALVRVGGFADPPVSPVLPSERQYRYRNHARFTIGPGGVLGFVNRETRQFVGIDDCQLMHGEVNRRLSQLQGNCGETTQLSIRAGTETEDYLVQPQLFHPDIPITTGQKSYEDSVDGKQFRVSSPSFFQVNIEQAATAVETVRQCLELKPEDVLLDAYTGVGTFAVLLAPYVKKVIAVEESSAAVADARENASGVENLEFLLGRTEDVLHRLEEKPAALVLDPPRSGCKPEALNSLIRLGIPRVAYVSCDAETLARDLKILCDGGYCLNRVVPIDMFPQTHHVECVAVLGFPGPLNSDGSLKSDGLAEIGQAAQLVLASASPRRKELLMGLGLDFQVSPADIDEVVLDRESPQETVARLSFEKAMKVASTLDSGVVIGADSMVVLEGRPIGKPQDEEDARRMLKALRGTSHHVTTGLTVIDVALGRSLTDSMTSDVTLREFSDAEIEVSIATGTPMDKAGAYAVQDNELHPAASWEGCYSNIIGLPLCRLLEMLKELGHAQIGLARIGDQPDPQLAQPDQLQGDQLQQRSKAASEFCGATCPSSGYADGSRDGNRGDNRGDGQ